MGIKYGFVKSDRSNEASKQEQALMNFGVDEFIHDMSPSGSKTYLYQQIEFLPKNSTIVVDSIKRLVANTNEMVELVDELNSRQIRLYAINEGIHTLTSYGRASIAHVKLLILIKKLLIETENQLIEIEKQFMG